MAPVLVTAVAAALSRGRSRWWLILVGAVATAAPLANVFIVHSLGFTYTI